jgi:hypothetical protein
MVVLGVDDWAAAVCGRWVDLTLPLHPAEDPFADVPGGLAMVMQQEHRVPEPR